MLSTHRLFNRDDRVTCSRTILATHDGKAITGPGVTGTIFDDDGQAHVTVRGEDGRLHWAYRNEVKAC